MIKPQNFTVQMPVFIAPSENSVEERSSLLNDSDPIAESILVNKPLQFENLGDVYEELQKKAEDFEEVKEDERAQLKKTITNLMSNFEDSGSNLNKSEVYDDSSSLIQDEEKLDGNAELNIIREDIIEPVDKLQKSELSQFEQDKITYL